MWEWSDWGNTLIFCWLANHMTSARKPTLHNSFFVPLWLTELHKADFIFIQGDVKQTSEAKDASGGVHSASSRAQFSRSLPYDHKSFSNHD